MWTFVWVEAIEPTNNDVERVATRRSNLFLLTTIVQRKPIWIKHQIKFMRSLVQHRSVGRVACCLMPNTRHGRSPATRRLATRRQLKQSPQYCQSELSCSGFTQTYRLVVRF